jgi:DNA-directed RNA polymerase subunit RPC12/RpoP
VPLIPVACHKCGAPLEVPGEARYVTCRHCGIQLEVKHNESAAWTEQIEDIKEQTEELVEQVAQLQYQNALDAIEQDWESFIAQNGRPAKLSKTLSSFKMCITVAIGLYFASQTGPGMPIMATMAVSLGVGIGIYEIVQANKLEEAKRRYQHRKASLKIDDFRKRATSGESFSPDSTRCD